MSADFGLKIIAQTPDWVAIDKPAGLHVHPPENKEIRITRQQNGMARLRDQLGFFVYPVHRLDPATSGVLIYALSGTAAGRLQVGFRGRLIKKTYWAVVRGLTLPEGVIERPLKRDSSDTLAEARTDFQRLAHIELPYAVRPHSSARYSWVRAHPASGVWHQIRRHFKGMAHPLIGDSQHGDGPHNRLFRDQLGFRGLWLRAQSLTLPADAMHEGDPEIIIQAPSDPEWQRLRSSLPWQIDCPFDS